MREREKTCFYLNTRTSYNKKIMKKKNGEQIAGENQDKMEIVHPVCWFTFSLRFQLKKTKIDQISLGIYFHYFNPTNKEEEEVDDDG